MATALDPLFNAILAENGKIVAVSEYSISAVSRSVAPNQLLRSTGLLQTRSTPDGILIDYKKSDAFALVDHQIAHVYVKPGTDRKKVIHAVCSAGGIEVLDAGIDHPRAGQIQLQASHGTWLTTCSDAPTIAACGGQNRASWSPIQAGNRVSSHSSHSR